MKPTKSQAVRYRFRRAVKGLPDWRWKYTKVRVCMRRLGAVEQGRPIVLPAMDRGLKAGMR